MNSLTKHDKNTDILIPVKAEHAEFLFPQVFQTKIVETILWDGPLNENEYHEGLKQREKAMQSGDIHLFTIVDPETNQFAGNIDIRPEENGFRADIGLWVGEGFQGKGLGSSAIQLITKYGFEKLKLEKIEASVFVDNFASRKIFEKAGYTLEGTVRCKVKKYDKYLDEWLFGKVKSEHK